MIFHSLKLMLTEKNYKSSFCVGQTGTPGFSLLYLRFVSMINLLSYVLFPSMGKFGYMTTKQTGTELATTW